MTTPAEKDAMALGVLEAKYCGRSVTMGHGEGASCGNQFYGIKFQCETCRSDSAANVRAYLLERVAATEHRLTRAEAELAAVGKADWRLIGTERRPKPHNTGEPEFVVDMVGRDGPIMAHPAPVEWETVSMWEATLRKITTDGNPPSDAARGAG